MIQKENQLIKIDNNTGWSAMAIETWIDIAAEEVQAGNYKSSLGVTQLGWNHLTAKFTKATGRDYMRSKHDNLWHMLRREWELWQLLVGESDLRWDPIKQTVEANDEWWSFKIEKFPDVAKFQVKGLGHRQKLDILFSDVDGNGNNRPRKRTRDGINKSIADALENGRMQLIRFDLPGCSTGEVLPLVEELPGIIWGDDLFMLATQLFCQREYREMFVALGEPTIRLAWLKRLKQRLPLPGCSIGEVLLLVEELPGVTCGDDFNMLATELFLRPRYREVFVALGEPATRLAWLRRIEQRWPLLI